jgi:hypothetical protein
MSPHVYYFEVIPEGTASRTPIQGPADPTEVKFAHLPLAAIVTLKTADASVVDGASTTLSGTLGQRQDRGPVEAVRHESVSLYSIAGKAKPELVGDDTTDTKGVFLLRVRPDSSASYVAVYAGRAPYKYDQGAGSAASAPAKIDVAQKVVAHAKDKSLAKHEKLVVTGTVSAAAAAQQVSLDYVKGSKQHQITTATLASDGSFTLSTKKPKSGKSYHLMVVSPATATNSAGVSKSFKVARA